MSIKPLTSPCVAPAAPQARQQPGKGYWLVDLVKQHFELRRQKQRRVEGLEAIRKLPLYLQADVGFDSKTKIDD